MSKKSFASGLKHFLLNILSSAIGFVAGGVIVIAILVIMLFRAMGGSAPSAVKDNSVLTISLSGQLCEQPPDYSLGGFMGVGDYSVALNEMLRALRIAKTDNRIKAVVLEAGLLQTQPAALQEIRSALMDYKKSRKPLYAYGDNYSQASYYLCSAADSVALNPSGIVEWRGLSAQTMYYTDLLQKLGIKMQVFKVGTYKSAVEPYINQQMSPANRQQVTAFTNDIWQAFLKDVAAGRRLTVEQANILADRFAGFAPAGELVKNGLVDTLIYKEDFYDGLRKQYCPDEDELRQVDAAALCQANPPAGDEDNTVAVYYAEGEIVDVKEMGLAADKSIVAGQVIKDLRQLRDDDDVKAVVLRINSGGGSAYASEQIWHAVRQLSKEKPVVVSMGGMAASGAYYMACGADYIFAEPTTLTGSIGIFGLVPDLSGLLQGKLGLKFDVVKTNQLADFGTLSRPFNQEESARMQSYIDNGYRLFVSRVAGGRKMNAARVDSIGQGRVWTGRQAIGIGLVDKLGTLQDAIAYAARKAKLKDDYAVRECPEIQPWYVSMGLTEAQAQARIVKTRAELGDLYLPYMIYKRLEHQSSLQARLPYLLKIQ